MLLALDAGNSNVTIGAFEGSKLIGRWRVRTIHEQTADEWGVLIRNLLLSSPKVEGVEGIVIASVVPMLNGALADMGERYFRTTPLFATPDTDIGIKVLYDNSVEVGADRVANGVAAFHRYGGPVVVVDLGTTINFDVVSAKGEYLGGVICPGITTCIQGLFAKTARLPMVNLQRPASVIGRNTVQCMQSGLYYGFAGMIDGILERVIAELGDKTTVIATGGQAPQIATALRLVEEINEDLTLEGLEMIWRRKSRTDRGLLRKYRREPSLRVVPARKERTPVARDEIEERYALVEGVLRNRAAPIQLITGTAARVVYTTP